MARVLFAAFFIVCSLTLPALAHPGHGIVVASNGDVFFADVERSLLWKIELTAGSKLTKVATRFHSHSLAIDPADNVYAEHLRYIAEGDAWEARVCRFGLHSGREEIIAPTMNPEVYPGAPFTVDDWGRVYFVSRASHAIMRTTGKSAAEAWILPGPNPAAPEAPPLTNVGAIYSRGQSMFITDGMIVRKAGKDNKLTTIADLANREVPADANPARSGKLWGICTDDAGSIYAADWDARCIHMIDKEGATSIVLSTEAPWAPTGVAARGKRLFVLEHGLENEKNLGPRVREVNLETGESRVLATVE